MKVFIALSLCVVFVFEVSLEQVFVILILSSDFSVHFEKMKVDDCISALHFPFGEIFVISSESYQELQNKSLLRKNGILLS